MDEGEMGAERPPGTDSVPPVGKAQMDQMDGNGQFPSNATPQDRRAFAEQILDRHAQQIYRYVLAWTNDRAAAEELTAQVLRGAVARMEQLSEPGTDLEARLISLARAAVARREEAADQAAASRDAGAFAAATEPLPFLLDAVRHLDDTRREVVILRLLLGQSTEHAARLLAFDAPVVEELERDACATLWRRVHRAPQTQQVMTWDALTVAAALRQGAPTWLAPPEEAVLARLRARLLDELEPDRRRVAPAAPAGQAAAERQGLLPRLTAFVQRRRWLLAGCVFSAAIGIVAALAMGGQMVGKGSSCGAPSCLVSTTAGNVSDTMQSPPPSPPEQSSGQPSTSSRTDGSSAFPAVSSSATATTTGGPMATTSTTVRGTTPGPSSTTRPRATTTTTKPGTTTTTEPPDTTTTTTLLPTSSRPS
jgi:DNA-directed RNA polymerase specialized sigma24 family protein